MWLLLSIALTVMVKWVLNRFWPEQWRVRDHLGIVGTALTLAYLAVILPVIWGRVGTLETMPLNEVGDFLAGAFGPVAFLWLVLGFVQQGQELRLQAIELKNSVDQQKEIAEAAKQQMKIQVQERDRALNALFTLEAQNKMVHRGSGWAKNQIQVKNEGKKALSAELFFEPHVNELRSLWLGDFPEGHEMFGHFDFMLVEGSQIGTCRLVYDDACGARREQLFHYSVSDVNIDFVRVRNH
ncbi:MULTISPECIES: hypothetical protein [Pseudomonas]|uniref:hypothetical protein n=1 Tax=Pseudomonas TaxID=286 RepID=UPI001DCEE113|nr:MULTISPECIES: hypothetical protein [unclassified Pseudomonas]MBS6039459.1 hypothetical protein [Pseudomonas sp.]